MRDADAGTGASGGSCVDDKVLSAYGRDTLHGNGQGMLAFSAGNQHPLPIRFSRHPYVETCTLSKVEIVGKVVNAWILSSRGNRTDDSYEMSLCVDLLE